MLPLSAHQCQEKPSVLPRFSSQCVQILISLTENYTAREDEVRFIPCDKTKKTSRTDSCVGLRKLKIGLVYLRISMINCILQHLYTLTQCIYHIYQSIISIYLKIIFEHFLCKVNSFT